MNEDVELAVLFHERGEELFDLAIGGDVALEAGGAGEFLDEVLGFELHALVLVTDGQGSAGLGELLCDAVGDAALVGEAEDDGYFAFEVNHDAR